MDRIIEVKVGGNYLTKDNKNAGVRGEANVTSLRITFDEGWDNYAKTVTFWDARGQNPVERILTTDLLENKAESIRVYLVPIPGEPMAEAGSMTFVIDGYIEGKRQRSMSDKLEVKDAPIADNAEEPIDPIPKPYEQFQEQIDAIKKDIQDTAKAKEEIENMSVSCETLPSDEDAFVVKIGEEGINLHFGIPAGKKSDPGNTPVKSINEVYVGSDEPTDESVLIWVNPDDVSEEAQTTPLFANSIDECTDTTKLYVLPDGDIYAYINVKSPLFTDVVCTSQSAGSIEPYNEIGYRYDGYISSNGGVEGDRSGCVVTGYIPITLTDVTKAEPVFYIKGAKLDRLGVYDISDKTFLTLFYQDSVYTAEELGADYYKVTPILKSDGQNAFYYNTVKKEMFLRFSLISNEDKGLIITLNEPIEYGEVSKWINTGIKFVSSVSDEKLASLEETTENHEGRISILENSSLDTVPEYIITEAERVANVVQNNRNAQSLVFAACSDFHCAVGDDTKQAILHTGYGIKEIRKYAPLDFVALFGDYVAGGSSSTIAGSKEELKYIHKCMYDAGNGIQQIWMQGNHDRNPYDTDDGDLTTDELYSYIGANNTGAVVDCDNPERIYGYKDFDQQKIRIIYLNSSDIEGATTVSDHMFSAIQLNWLINTALNFDDKDNPTDWGIVIMSHMPLNWMNTPLNIIDAYISGSSIDFTNDGTRVVYDFTNTTRAEVLCFVNGHTHNFRMSQIGTNNTWQIAVPQVCAGRYNEYGTSWAEVGGELDDNGDPVYWYKTPDSATSTSFVVFVIDRKNKKISAIHYGAGIDREASY